MEQTVKLSKIKPNPGNPRFIKDENFERLVESIRKYPKFLEKRPIVIHSWGDPHIIGGTQRYRALRKIGYKEVPSSWIRTAEDYSPDEVKAFTILDNVSAGQWDFEELANNWDLPELENFGVFIPNLNADDEDDETGYGEPGNLILPKDRESSGLSKALGPSVNPDAVEVVLVFTKDEFAFFERESKKYAETFEAAVLECLKQTYER